MLSPSAHSSSSSSSSFSYERGTRSTSTTAVLKRPHKPRSVRSPLKKKGKSSTSSIATGAHTARLHFALTNRSVDRSDADCDCLGTRLAEISNGFCLGMDCPTCQDRYLYMDEKISIVAGAGETHPSVSLVTTASVHKRSSAIPVPGSIRHWGDFFRVLAFGNYGLFDTEIYFHSFAQIKFAQWRFVSGHEHWLFQIEWSSCVPLHYSVCNMTYLVQQTCLQPLHPLQGDIYLVYDVVDRRRHDPRFRFMDEPTKILFNRHKIANPVRTAALLRSMHIQRFLECYLPAVIARLVCCLVTFVF